MNEYTDSERLFLAFWPDADLRQRVQALAAPALEQSRARPVPGDNLHVTLVFVGNWPVDKRGQIELVVDSLSIPDETLEFERIETWQKPGVLALVGEDCPPAVTAYQRNLSAGMAALGWTPETRPFRPHVTFGRKTRRRVRRVLDEPLAWPCHQVALVRSEAGDNGSRYRPLRIWDR